MSRDVIALQRYHSSTRQSLRHMPQAFLPTASRIAAAQAIGAQATRADPRCGWRTKPQKAGANPDSRPRHSNVRRGSLPISDPYFGQDALA
jgi:hypothetical protein